MDKIWYILTYLIVNALDLGVTAKYMDFFSRKTESAKKQSKDYIYFMLHYRQFAVYFISDSAG